MLQLLYAWLGAAAFVASLAYFLFAYVVTFGESAAAGTPLAAVAIDIALFSLFALHHSLFARSSLKAAVREVLSPAMERTLYTWISALLFAMVCWAWQPVPGVLYSVPAPWHWLGYATQAAGIAVTAAGSRVLDVLDLAGVRPVLVAQGGAQPRHVPLQTGGLYGFVRHPIYFGWLLFVFGTPHMTMTRLVFALTSSAYLALAIPWEERGLIQVFGADYRQYQQRVRWRMLPFLY